MDQTEKATSIQHPEEEEHHENGASKMFRKVKAKAKKFKNSITKQGQSNEHDHDVVEEDDEDDAQEPEVISAPVRSGVTDQPESLSHPRETTTVPAPEKIVPPGTKVSPVVSSDYTKPIEPVPLQDTSSGQEPTHHSPLRVSELSDREESRETHHEALNTPVSLLSETEDVTTTFAPHEVEQLGGQRKVNKKLEDDPAVQGGGSDYLNGVSNYQSTVNDSTHKGGEEDGVTEIGESLGNLKVSDESSDQKFERDLPTRSHEVDRETESAIDKDSPVTFGAELEKDSSTRSHEFDMTTESGIDKDSPSRSYEFDLKTESGIDNYPPTGFSSELKTRAEEDFQTKSHESEHKTESENVKNSPTGFNSELGAKLGEDSPTRSYESDQKTESEDKNAPTGFGGELEAKLREDSPTRSYESDQKTESEKNKNSTTGSVFGLGEDFPAKESHGYGEESEAELEKNFPTRSDDVKVETELGRDLTTETYDQFSPELSRPTKRDEFEESRDSFEEKRDETTQEPKQSTYTEQLASATPAIPNKAIEAKNAVASKLGYSGESTKGDETDDEKLTPVNKTGSTVSTELPLSGGASDLEEKKQREVEEGVSPKNYLAEKLTPGEEDKALSEVIAEKLRLGGSEKKAPMNKEVEATVEKIPSEKEPEEEEHGEEVTEEVQGGGGGMVGMIKGWFGGGATEEVKPKSPHSVEESSQSLGSTVGTMGFSDSGKSELGETGGSTGAVPVQRGLGN